MEHAHHRAHLRSPVNRSLFFTDGKNVHLAQMLNISAGGLLFCTENSSIPDTELHFLASIPQTPHLKNFNEQQIFDYDISLFPATVVRTQGKIVRRFKTEGELRKENFGVAYTKIGEKPRQLIENFSERAASNVSYLQALLDSSKNTEKINKVVEILGYPQNLSKEDLATLLMNDLMSLRWT